MSNITTPTKARGLMSVRAEGNPAQILAGLNEAFERYKRGQEGALAEINSRIDEIEAAGNRAGLGGNGGAADSGAVNIFNSVMAGKSREHRPIGGSEYTRYQTALASYFRRGEAALQDPDVRATLQVGSDPDGGYTVLPDRDQRIRARLWRTSPMRAVASVQTIAGDALEGLYDADEFEAGWVGEHDSRPETETGQLGEWRIPADELYAMAPVTQRLLDDSGIDIGAWVESKLDRRFRRKENAAFVTGDGVKKPRGFLDYKDTAVTTADETRAWGVLQYIASGSAGGFPKVSGSNADDAGALYDTIAALNAEYRPDAVWAMNSQTEAMIQKLKDAEGRPLHRTSLDDGSPNRLLGYPIIIMEDMPDPGSDSFSLAFGNFGEAYQIVEKLGTRVLRDPYTTKGRTKFYAWRRVGGNVVGFDSLKLVKLASS